MLRGINDFEVPFIEFGMALDGFDQSAIGIINLFADDGFMPRLSNLLFLKSKRVAELRKDLQQRGDGIGGQLAAIGIIGFEAIVFFRVMGGRDHDAPGAA